MGGETIQETPESYEQVSSKDEDTTENSSEGEIKDETKHIEKEDGTKDLTEKSSEGETNQEAPESSVQISSNDQDTTEKSKGETIQETPESNKQDTTENSSEGEI